MVEMKLTNYVIGLLIIGAIVTGYLSFFSDFSANYGVTADTTAYENTYNQLNDMNEDILAAQNTTFGIASDNDAQFFTGIWSAVKLSITMVKSSVIVGSDIVVNSFEASTGIETPPYIPALILGILAVLLVFSIVAMIVRRSV